MFAVKLISTRRQRPAIFEIQLLAIQLNIGREAEIVDALRWIWRKCIRPKLLDFSIQYTKISSRERVDAQINLAYPNEPIVLLGIAMS